MNESYYFISNSSENKELSSLENCEGQGYTARERTVFGLLAGLDILLVVTVNSVIFVGFTVRKSLRKYPSATIIYLMMVTSDLLTGLVAMPGYTIRHLNNNHWVLGEIHK